MRIRTASVADLPAVLGLWSQERSGHASVADRREAVELLLERDPDALLVAEVEDEIVAALIAAWDGWRGNMYRLAVRPDRRRRGIGRALVRAGEESLRRRGAVRVTALVAFEDEVAGGFWDAAGYPPDQAIGRRVRNL
ncbi:MAG TPA: GNAT family N-acetyltransferase [Solirubrobacterales bacterium]|nr:GNAT family N-acetyltransferase [Solirubrobacterales bacterium]